MNCSKCGCELTDTNRVRNRCKPCINAGPKAKYRNKNRDKLHRYNKEYQSRPEISEHRKILNSTYQKQTQPQLRSKYRSLLYQCIKRESDSIERVVGIKFKAFKEYITSLFIEGMTWNNKGKGGWEIDHIVPLSAFDLTKQDEVNKAMHYTNLRPLWAKDNLSKHANLVTPSDHMYSIDQTQSGHLP